MAISTKYWHNLNEKLPKINTDVFVLKSDYGCVVLAKLMVYTKSSQLNNHNFVEGDIFWRSFEYNGKNNDVWMSPEKYPYWMTEKDFLEMISFSFPVLEKEELKNEISNRADILDL